MTLITARDNKKLKFARAVRDGRERGYIFIEGVRLAEESMRSGVEIVEMFQSESFVRTRGGDRIEPVIVADRLFDSIAETKNSQGIVIIAKRPETSTNLLQEADGNATEFFLFLSEINNPSNLGAIMRTAEAAGVTAVIVSKGSADVFSPKALRSAMGANLRIPIYENAIFDVVIGNAREKGIITTAADINGSKSYTDIEWRVPRLLIFGSEAHGLSEGQLGQIDELIVIPMKNEVESLNLAVSCGIILFEAKRQLG